MIADSCHVYVIDVIGMKFKAFKNRGSPSANKSTNNYHMIALLLSGKMHTDTFHDNSRSVNVYPKYLIHMQDRTHHEIEAIFLKYTYKISKT